MRGDRPFSEFTYAFAATHELARLSHWWSRHVPVIPSLRAEGRLGYDVRFDLPGSFLFIQFKLTTERQNLRLVGDELRQSSVRTQLRSMAYAGIRQFWTDSNQHRLLTKLSSKFESAYYFAPKFTSQAELNHHFARRTIARSSFIVRIDQFPGPRSDNQHRHRVIGPNATPNRVFIFSEPIEVQSLEWRAEMIRLARGWPDSPPLGLQLSELWKEIPGKLQSRERRITTVRRAFARQPGLIASDALQLGPIEIPAAADAMRRVGAVKSTRIPPWEAPIRSFPVESDLGGRAELFSKLLIVSDELERRGIALAIAQPRLSA